MEPRELFYDLLTEEAQENVPIHYRLIQGHRPEEATGTRVATSAHHRSRGYVCQTFYKPLSRCFPFKTP
jgi:hypothetical protein